ncbi:S8 family serine peptidase [Fulvivirga sediminis]|uniref:S8 family serine peptidase n=1 Tax=Fulvivirga sediminis TaxID=2803949 RepID=A0A937K1K8_9BACT|nr:S8 family serine peptidase [Fulvivirga sediminis]MBL3657445.1 S8 family serine peptidase [Fulvivirga sediminis]
MKNLTLKYPHLISIAILFSCLIACDEEDHTIKKTEVREAAEITLEKHGDIISGSYIVTLKQGSAQSNMRTMKGYANRQAVAKPLMHEMIKRAGLQLNQLENVYSAAGMMGFSINNVASSNLARLKRMPEVESITPNRVIALLPSYCDLYPWMDACSSEAHANSGQTIPWGVTWVGGPTDMSNSSKKAFVIDTGIDLDHPDLNLNTSLSVSFVGSNGNDGNGHGTHLAGTIGAIDNNIGVVGVAAGIQLVAVQVLNNQGSGSYAGVIAGIDYVAQTGEPGDVVNLSLGGPANNSIDNAVIALGASGIYISIAAGNAAQNANNVSPARVNGANIFTVSNMNNKGWLANTSNYGNPPIDYAAPGTNILSTWLNGGYNTLSGSSMAAAHVSGLLLVTNGNIQINGYANGDPDGTPDPIAHQ